MRASLSALETRHASALSDLAAARASAEALGATANERGATIERQGGELSAPLANRLFVQATAFVGDEAGADFDHDATRIAQHAGGGSHVGERSCHGR